MDSLPIDLMREEVTWRQSAGLLDAKTGDPTKMTKAELVAALGGPAAPETTAKAKKE